MSSTVCPSCGGNVDAASGVCPDCATRVADRDSAAPTVTATGAVTDRELENRDGPPDISGYHVIGRLGEGGMGAVYLAEETSLGRRVAVKVISRAVALHAQAKARFLREARTLATIEHPHVVRVYSFGEVGGRPYLAMEYVEGETLTERILRLGRMSVDDALRITREIVEALEAAWERNVIHRDIKPSNILIDRRNRVRVADFGLAKPMNSADDDHSLTQTGLMVGTPHYVSPEQAQGKNVDFRSDFYSLGIMLFHMLTGERPFTGSTPVAVVAKHLHEPMPMLRSRRPDAPPEVDRLILWMTEKDPARRPSSHADLLAAIDALITRTPTAPMPTFSTIAVEPIVKTSRLRMFGAVAAMLAIIISSIVFFRSRREDSALSGPTPIAQPSRGFVVAVAPFYGPDADSAKEGRVMAALIERAVAQRLGQENARVAGIEETKDAVRSHDEAREIGRKLGAAAVIWGEAFALRTETEIRPYVTIVSTRKEKAGAAETSSDARLLSAKRDQSLEAIADSGGAAVKLEAEAPNQIELRKTSATGIGDVVMLLAGIYALDTERNYDKALALFRQAPRTAETLRYEVQALLRANHRDEARTTLEEALKLDPTDAPSEALLGDLHMSAGRTADAIAAYGRAAAMREPYTTTRGILHEGKLYAKETYQHSFANDGKETETLSLLAIDPASQRVVARHALPGLINSFRIEGDELVIDYNGNRDAEPLPGELRMKQGRFDRPVWTPPNFIWRLKSMRGGRIIAGNFLRELDTIRHYGKPAGRFILGKDIDPKLPSTLPDLERALREAMVKDPTNPWHPYFLALTLRAAKRPAEADAVFAELVRNEWPGVEYFHFTWMMSTLERLRYTEWTDRLYTRALAKRREIPHPAPFSTLIERLINVPWVRQTAVNRDVARGAAVLAQARELGGVAPEGDDLVAAAWAKKFEADGDAARAKQQRDVVRIVNAHPFNYLGVMAKLDYATTATAATLFGLLALLTGVLVNAMRRARDSARSGGTSRWRERLVRYRAIVAGLAIGGGLLLVMWAMVVDAVAAVLISLGVIAALIVAAWRFLITPRGVFSSITRRERLALTVAWLLFAAATVAMLDHMTTVNTVASMPIGISDSIGHVKLVSELESRLKEDDSTPALRYAAAVANHYAGNRQRAEELYATVSGYPNASKNVEGLRAGLPPAVALSSDDLFAALQGSRAARWWKLDAGYDRFFVAFALATVGFPLLLLAMFSVRPRTDAADNAPPSRWLKAAMLFVPGLYDVHRGAVWRALATAVLLMIAVPPLITLIAVPAIPAVGRMTAEALPSLTAFPLPTTSNDAMRELGWTIRMAYPYARVFWVIVLGAGLAGLALHLLRVPAILREPRADMDQVPRSNLASVST